MVFVATQSNPSSDQPSGSSRVKRCMPIAFESSGSSRPRRVPSRARIVLLMYSTGVFTLARMTSGDQKRFCCRSGSRIARITVAMLPFGVVEFHAAIASARSSTSSIGDDVTRLEPGQRDVVGDELLNQLDADELRHRRVIDHGLDDIERIAHSVGRRADRTGCRSGKACPAKSLFRCPCDGRPDRSGTVHTPDSDRRSRRCRAGSRGRGHAAASRGRSCSGWRCEPGSPGRSCPETSRLRKRLRLK